MEEITKDASLKMLSSGITLMLSHHDDESRETRCLSFGFRGGRIYVCTRCLAMAVGLASFLVVTAILPEILAWFSRETAAATLIAFLFCLPMALDGGLQVLGVREGTTASRLATGFAFGLFVPVFAVAAAPLRILLAVGVLASIILFAFKGEALRSAYCRITGSVTRRAA